MSLEEYYNLAKEFFTIANKFDYTNRVGALRNTLASIKSLKTSANPTQAQLQQQIQQHRNNIDPQKNALIASIQSVRDELLNSQSYEDFYDDFIGIQLIEKINGLTPSIDTTDFNFLSEVEQILQKPQTFYSFYHTISTTVRTLGISETELIKQDALILTFENAAFIDDLRGLKKASEDWGFIVHSFGRLLNENDTKAEVLSITRGSLILSLAIVRIVLKAITQTSNEICESILKVLQVKQKILEIRKLTNSVSSPELDAVEKKESIKVSALTKKITEKLMQEYQSDPSKVDYHEIEDFVKKSVRKMILFHSKGGKAEAKLLSPTENEKETIEITKRTNEELKKIEDTIKGLAEGKEILLLDSPDEEELKDEVEETVDKVGEAKENIEDEKTSNNDVTDDENEEIV